MEQHRDRAKTAPIEIPQNHIFHGKNAYNHISMAKKSFSYRPHKPDNNNKEWLCPFSDSIKCKSPSIPITHSPPVDINVIYDENQIAHVNRYMSSDTWISWKSCTDNTAKDMIIDAWAYTYGETLLDAIGILSRKFVPLKNLEAIDYAIKFRITNKDSNGVYYYAIKRTALFGDNNINTIHPYILEKRDNKQQ